MTTPGDHHREVAGTFTERVRGVADWDAPTPVAGWVARDVVAHLVEWFPAFLAGGSSIALPAGPPVADEPAAAWEHQTAAIQRVLDDPAAAAAVFLNPHTGELPVATAVDRFYTADVFMHTWDLARATGQDDTLDAASCAELLAGMTPIEDVLRASGQFGPAVPVSDDAAVQDRLIAFIGRDPAWRPPR